MNCKNIFLQIAAIYRTNKQTLSPMKDIILFLVLLKHVIMSHVGR